jgi:hypothetical protein
VHVVDDPYQKKAIIFIHDCNPTNPDAALPFKTLSKTFFQSRHKTWNGDVWKAIYMIKKLYPEIDIKVYDTDAGLGVINMEPGFQEKPIPESLKAEVARMTYDDLAKNRVEFLNLTASPIPDAPKRAKPPRRRNSWRR